MKVQDLKDLRKNLDNIILDSEKSITSTPLHMLEEMAFSKYQTFIVWAISYRKSKISTYSENCPDKEKLKSELKQFEFVEKNIELFIDAEMQDARDQVDCI